MGDDGPVIADGWRDRIPGPAWAAARRLGAAPTTVGIVESEEERDARLNYQRIAKRARWDQRVARDFGAYAGASVGTLTPRQRPDLIGRWVESPTQALFVVGAGVGAGKTYAAMAAGAGRAELGEWVVPWTTREWIDAALSRDPEVSTQAWDEARYADVLILDDFGVGMTERPPAYVAGAVTTLVDARVRSGRPLILTTNLPYASRGEDTSRPLGLEDLFDDRVLSRLQERRLVVTVEGPDRRRANGAPW